MITIGFSTHRPEVLAKAEKLMAEHEVIALEEPYHPLFQKMLDGSISIDDYLMEIEYEFPEFARASCEIYRRLHTYGKVLLQIDPYMEELSKIHELFARGGSQKDIPPEGYARRVYTAEKKATESLLNFYKIFLSGNFLDLVKAVKNFARSDSQRILLRDQMRAIALATVANRTSALYVEAGYIHWALQHYLRQTVYPRRRLKIRFLLESETKSLTGKKQIFGPGDTLTLLFMFHPNIDNPVLDLLGARSLIFIKIIQKNELQAKATSYPHLEDESKAYLLTKRLSWDDCKKLWDMIRFKSSDEARLIVENYLAKLR